MSIHDDEILGKAYDGVLMRRLLTYLRPYWRQAVVALLAIVVGAAVALAQRWFGTSPLSLYAQGGAEHGYVSVLATFAKGQTAVISSDLVRDGAEPCGESPAATLVLLGNHGSMQFTDTPGSDGLPVDLAPPQGGPQQQLLRLIQESLREGKPAS